MEGHTTWVNLNIYPALYATPESHAAIANGSVNNQNARLQSILTAF
jgi:hypothetical protein